MGRNWEFLTVALRALVGTLIGTLVGVGALVRVGLGRVVRGSRLGLDTNFSAGAGGHVNGGRGQGFGNCDSGGHTLALLIGEGHGLGTRGRGGDGAVVRTLAGALTGALARAVLGAGAGGGRGSLGGLDGHGDVLGRSGLDGGDIHRLGALRADSHGQSLLNNASRLRDDGRRRRGRRRSGVAGGKGSLDRAGVASDDTTAVVTNNRAGDGLDLSGRADDGRQVDDLGNNRLGPVVPNGTVGHGRRAGSNGLYLGDGHSQGGGGNSRGLIPRVVLVEVTRVVHGG